MIVVVIVVVVVVIVVGVGGKHTEIRHFLVETENTHRERERKKVNRKYLSLLLSLFVVVVVCCCGLLVVVVAAVGCCCWLLLLLFVVVAAVGCCGGWVVGWFDWYQPGPPLRPPADSARLTRTVCSGP